jgi:hypothetical protein
MTPTVGLPGERYGKLIILSEEPKRNAARYVLCQCDCGIQTTVQVKNLRSGMTKSCGCLHQGTPTHGHTVNHQPSRTYRSWEAMKARCDNKSSISWPGYGGRGITVCDRWKHSFENFLADMGERPPGHTLDRINSKGNYDPSNCRWATPSQQRLNR